MPNSLKISWSMNFLRVYLKKSFNLLITIFLARHIESSSYFFAMYMYDNFMTFLLEF